MTERGLPSIDGSAACPFVAFEDDRDERADRPDPRHRCYAEIHPGPRALAHQEAYCLSSAFPVCPTFQEWAHREAARARASDEAPSGPPTGALVASDAAVTDSEPGGSDDDRQWEDDAQRAAAGGLPVEERPYRNPPRDWAAPPPWAGGAGAGSAGSRRSAEEGPPDFLAERPEGRGLAGSAADRLASGEDLLASPLHPAELRHGEPRGRADPDSPSSPADPELAGLLGPTAGRGAAAARPRAQDDPDDPYRPPQRPGRRPAVSSTRGRDRERERERERAAERSSRHDGPAWEQQRRYEAYPTIKTRAGLPSLAGLPRVVLLFVALIIAAAALFFLPGLLGVGGPDRPGATPSPSVAAPSASLEPTPIPAATPQVYVIKKGDTLLGIARDFGLTLEQLLAANKDTISNPNRIAVGDEIIIPIPPPDAVGSEPAASPSP